MALRFRRWHLRNSLLASSKGPPARQCQRSLIQFHTRCHTSKATNPLRILFCGSDKLSVTSLEALHREHVKHPEHIASIDVVSRPAKKVGRGLKVTNKLPITTAAEKLTLPSHTIDTFTGWSVCLRKRKKKFHESRLSLTDLDSLQSQTVNP